METHRTGQLLLVSFAVVFVTSGAMLTGSLLAQVDLPPHGDGEEGREIAEPVNASHEGGDGQGEEETREHADAERTEGDTREETVTRDRPLRLRAGDRERLREENAAVERLGQEIDRLREAALDEGVELSIDALRAEAEERLWQGAQGFQSDDTGHGFPEGGEPWHGAEGGAWSGVPQNDAPFAEEQHQEQNALVCFRSDGSVTGNREECDPDQGHHFGSPAWEDDGNGDASHEESFAERMQEKFAPTMQQFGGPRLLEIIGNALQRLSGALDQVRGTEGEQQVRDAIGWLTGILARYASGEPSPEESARLGGEIHERLSVLQGTFGGGPELNRRYGPPMPTGAQHGYGGGMPDVSEILMRMDFMMGKISQVIEIFERGGVPIAPEARQAADEALAKFREIRPACAEDVTECMRMQEVFRLLEERMRPPMERAIMESRNFEVMMEVERLMSEGEDRFGPPPGLDHGGPPQDFGPPPGFDHGYPPQGYGPPPGFGPSQGYGPPPGYGYPEDFGPPPGFGPPGYGPPEGYPREFPGY